MHNFSDILSAQSQTLTAFYHLSASCRIPLMQGHECVADTRNLPDAMHRPYQGAAQLNGQTQPPKVNRGSDQGYAFTGGMNSLYQSRQNRSRIICDALLSFLAAFFRVSVVELRGAGRGTSVVARIRQFGMYIAHTMFDLSMSEVAYGFNRERTTVKHACHLIEDMREDADFDRGKNKVDSF